MPLCRPDPMPCLWPTWWEAQIKWKLLTTQERLGSRLWDHIAWCTKSVIGTLDRWAKCPLSDGHRQCHLTSILSMPNRNLTLLHPSFCKGPQDWLLFYWWPLHLFSSPLQRPGSPWDSSPSSSGPPLETWGRRRMMTVGAVRGPVKIGNVASNSSPAHPPL